MNLNLQEQKYAPKKTFAETSEAAGVSRRRRQENAAAKKQEKKER